MTAFPAADRPEVAHVLAAVGIAVCVGVVVVVWVAGALYNAFRSSHSASHAPRERTRSQPGLTAGDGGLIGVTVVCVGLAVAGRSHFDGLAVGALWVRTFPDDYPRYRRRVPQLIPGLHVLRQRHSASSRL